MMVLMNILSAHSQLRTYAPRLNESALTVDVSPTTGEDHFESSRTSLREYAVGGIYTALPLVGAFGHIHLATLSPQPAVERAAMAGCAANFLGMSALAAYTFVPHTALLLTSVAACAASGVAGIVATANLPASRLS